MTNRKSFDSIDTWLEDLSENVSDEAVLMLLGNKSDLVIKKPELRKVQSALASQYAKERRMLFKEVTSNSHVDINDSFDLLLDQICESKNVQATLRE